MAQPVQTYKNHRRFFPLFHFVAAPILAANLVIAIRRALIVQTSHYAWEAVVAFGLVALAFSARLMALRVQDRVIRLEMRARLRDCLAPDLRARIGDLTPEQLVALRFASDAEMSDLVREVLGGQLGSQKAIKLKVKEWQGDFLRA